MLLICSAQRLAKHAAVNALLCLWMIMLAACQAGSPEPAGTQVVAGSPVPAEDGICQSYESSEYVLPYPVGTEYTLIQGFNGRFSHRGVFEYAVDFDMPIGTRVTAARGGRVMFIAENYTDDDSGIQNANVVVVQHDDGTFGRYVHLTHNGAEVKMDQSVAPGDTIGFSGSSGSPSIAHLHFDVTEDCPQSNCQTIAVCFRNTKPHPDGLVTGKTYTAEADK